MPQVRRFGPLVLAALVLASCGGGAARAASSTTRTVPAQSRPPATAGALSLVPDGRAARERLAYADRKRLRAAGLAAAPLSRRVLGARRTTIAIGTARRAFTPGAAPETTVIAPSAVSAVQSCLGDAAAQTILGPTSVGDDAAIGGGVAVTQDGNEVRLCFAPRLIRNLSQSERRLEATFGRVRGARVTGVEIGEREIMTATVPAGRITRARLAELVAAGPALRRLAAWD